ncbi:acetylglucosamine transferase, partial [Polynucleobacter paneuropaeus]|nr:acetylglucosamine transferase [Polynucleobacter paneuropaeus]
DLFLDTHPYNAHTTAIDALKAGVPVITYLGQAFPGRVAASLLNAVGLPELVATSLQQYEDLAILLALSPNTFFEIKNKLTRNSGIEPLFNHSQFRKNLESIYTDMYTHDLTDGNND